MRTSLFVSMLGSSIALATLSGASLVPLPARASTVCTSVTSEPPAGFAELTERAERQRDARSYEESARSFAAAFAALSKRERLGLKGEISILNAVDDYRLAQERAPESLALLEEERTLLERYLGARSRAGDDALPPGILEELERVRARIDQQEHAQHEAARRAAEAAEARQAARARRAARARQVASAQQAAAAAQQLAQSTQREAQRERLAEARTRRRTGTAILGAGLASISGGVTLVASGAWNLHNVRRRGDQKLAAVLGQSGGTALERQAMIGEIERWQQRWRVVGTGLAVGGAVLAAAGVGLTVWGGLRVRRGRARPARAKVVSPMISGHGVGVRVTMRF